MMDREVRFSQLLKKSKEKPYFPAHKTVLPGTKNRTSRHEKPYFPARLNKEAEMYRDVQRCMQG